MNINIILAIGFGGFLGAVLRFLISGYINRFFNSPLPFGTLSVNIIGSFLIGFLFLYFQQINLSSIQKLIFTTGLLGALTTFSTFSLETIELIENGLVGKAILNIALNVSLSLGATIFGIALFKKIYGV